jgi:hypothetical protein
MIDPEETDTGKEWIELYNNDSLSVDLQDWKIQSAGISFVNNLSLPNLIIEPYSFILIGENEVPNCNFYHNLDFQNGGTCSDGIRITNPDETYTDSFIYDSPNTNNLPDDISNPASDLFNGDISGLSVKRKTDGLDNNLNSDWIADNTYTPGFSNNNYIDIQITNIYISVTENSLRINTVIHNLSTINVDLHTSSIIYVIDSVSYNLDPLLPFNSENLCFLSTEIAGLSTGIHKLTVNAFSPGDINTVNNSMSRFFQIGKTLIINEIMPAPNTGQSEWIELYNSSDKTISLSETCITDASNGHINFSAQISAHSYLILCPDPDNFLNQYPSVDPALVIQSKSWTSLNNNGDALKLFFSGEMVIDSMQYAADLVNTGFSLERFDDNGIIEWRSSTAESGGSPGTENGNTQLLNDLSLYNAGIKRSGDKLLHTLFIKGNLNDPNKYYDLKIYEKTADFDYALIHSESRVACLLDSVTIESNCHANEYRFYLYSVYTDEDNNQQNNSLVKAYTEKKLSFVVNEIMYNPFTGEPEWIELCQNVHLAEIDTIGIICNQDSLFFCTDDNQYIILCRNSADSLFLRQKYNLENVNIHTGLSNLSNSGEQIKIKDKFGFISEDFRYKSTWSSEKGTSIERRSPNIGPEDSNWGSCRSFNTIGDTNSIFQNTESANGVFLISPKHFSYKNEESILFSFISNDEINKAEIRIFDLKGRQLKLIRQDNNPGYEINEYWNGKDNNGCRVKPGIYIIRLRVFFNNGKVKDFTELSHCGY